MNWRESCEVLSLLDYQARKSDFWVQQLSGSFAEKRYTVGGTGL